MLQTENLDYEDNVMCVDDFNCLLNPKLDEKRWCNDSWKTDNIECFQNELDLVDIWRINNPQPTSYTWSQKSPQIFCLDYWLISSNLQYFIDLTAITSTLKTNHATIQLVLTKSRQEAKGPVYWEMNVSSGG